jgi:hypothetical protein
MSSDALSSLEQEELREQRKRQCLMNEAVDMSDNKLLEHNWQIELHESGWCSCTLAVRP